MKKRPKALKPLELGKKSLKLNKETLALLNSSDLPNVVGGASMGPSCGFTSYCCED